MQPNRTKLAVVDLIVLFIVGAVGLGFARSAQSFSALAALALVALGFVVTLVSYFHMRLEERERVEKMEFDELTKTPSSSALFQAQEGETLPARRAREQFEKYFVPIVSVLLLLAEAAGVFFLWRWLAKAQVVPLQQPMLVLILFGLFALVLFLLGRYSVALARLEAQRLLEPIASFVLADSYICAAAAGAIIAVYFGFERVDIVVARVLVVLLGLVATEMLLTLVLEIYRPRVKGKQGRLLYDSRIIGLLARPESLFTTAAHALDYQFGFKVSETWFYQFIQRSISWIIIGQCAILLASTSFVAIEPGEQALLERLGKPLGVLEPGAHLKLPWPIDKAYRYRAEQIQTFTIGIAPEKEPEHETVVLWTVGHYKEEFNLLVASRESESAVTNAAGKKAPPVNLLSVSIPVQFQITNLTAWAYNNKDADKLLEKLATREVVRYLVSADLLEIVSRGRGPAANTLRDRIQSAADERKLGARIVFVGLQDIHPPVSVAGSYEKVVGAAQTREAKILAARAQGIRTNAWSEARAFQTRSEAGAERVRLEVTALARAASFTNQIPAFRAAPDIYKLRNYLRTLTEASAGARKYVIATTNVEQVLQYNLEDKLRTDLMDIPVAAPRKTP